MESSLAFAPDFSKSGGLIAAVAQDAETLDVLMLAWMNPEAWEKTLETGEAIITAAAASACGIRRHVGACAEGEVHPA